jgi:hypothetical protein
MRGVLSSLYQEEDERDAIYYGRRRFYCKRASLYLSDT